MAYVRKKKVKGRVYYQLVEGRRVNGQPRQKVLLHLGRHETVDAALKEWPREIRKLRDDARRERERVPPGQEDSMPAYRAMLKKAASAERRADTLAEHLQRLRDHRKRGEA